MSSVLNLKNGSVLVRIAAWIIPPTSLEPVNQCDEEK